MSGGMKIRPASFQTKLDNFGPGPLGPGNGKVWKVPLLDSTILFGVNGTGQHTHIGSDFNVMKNEITGKHRVIKNGS